MQINNNNGSVIVITDININNNSVVYSVYEFGNIHRVSSNTYYFKTVVLKDYLLVSTNYYNLCYQKLIEELDINANISEDKKNWAIPIGSTGLNTTIRIYIPDKLISEEINSNSTLDILIKQIVALYSFAQKLENGSMQYLEMLEQDARIILESYLSRGVIIENR